MARSRSSIFDNVDPALVRLIQSMPQFGKYGVRATSGYRAGDTRYHGKDGIGRALDVELFDPASGTALANYQNPENFAAYQQLANALYQQALKTDPALAQKLRWGGYFSGGGGKYGALDLMHFDVAGDETGMAGGSWAGGLTPEQAKIWGLTAGGGIGGDMTGGAAGAQQLGPAMPKSVTNFSPEQRRNAIASIESAGSGDYGALGPMTGGDPSSRDRAYGRYQVMGRNVPVWTKQVLGRAMTPQEFLKDPKAQDAVFDKIFGEYVQKHGEEGAASMWFTGRPDAFDAKDVLGTSGGSYIKKYMNALTGQAPGGDTRTYPDQSPATAVAGAGPSPDQGGKEKDFGLGDLLESAGGIFGAGKGGQQRSTGMMRTLMPTQPITTAGIQSSTAMTPEAANARLQLALQRLNTGKLWG